MDFDPYNPSISLSRRADSGEADDDGGEGGGGSDRRRDRGAGSARLRRPRGSAGAPAPADEEDGGEAKPLDLPRPWRLLRDSLREGFLFRRQGQRSRRLPFLPRQLALQGIGFDFLFG